MTSSVETRLNTGLRRAGAARASGLVATEVPFTQCAATSPANTVSDCLKFRAKVGLDVAIEAIRDAWRERPFTLDALDRYSSVCRVQRVMQPYIEALTA